MTETPKMFTAFPYVATIDVRYHGEFIGYYYRYGSVGDYLWFADDRLLAWISFYGVKVIQDCSSTKEECLEALDQ